MSEPVGEWDARRHPEGLATSRSIRSQGHLYGPFSEEKAVIKDHKCTKNPFGHCVNRAFIFPRSLLVICSCIKETPPRTAASTAPWGN